MSAVCPKCGVAVVPGYIKCPKCQAPLPRLKKGASAGGTVAAGGGFPVMPFVVGGVLALGIVLYFALRKNTASEAAPAPETDQVDVDPADNPGQPTSDPTTLPDPTPAPSASAPDQSAAIKALDKALQKNRLWGTVQVVGGARIDVRSGACNDPTMAPVLDAASAPLHEAGLTKLRCLEQSGAVVFERDL